MSKLEEYKEGLEAHGVPYLGSIIWYYVGEQMDVQHPDLVKMIVEEGASISLPSPPRPGDIFKRACTASAILRAPTENANEYFNYTLRDAGTDAQFVYKKLIQERVDSSNHELGYNEIADIIFRKATGEIKYTLVDIDYESAFIEVRDSIDQYIKDNLFTVTPYALRMSLMNAIQGPLYGSCVREGGGVYFVSEDYKAQVEAIDRVVAKIDGASFHYLPLVDDQRQRAMVRDSFEDESITATQKLMTEITDLLQGGNTVSAKKFLLLQTRYSELVDKMREYQDILGDALAQSSATLELCESQIMRVLESVE